MNAPGPDELALRRETTTVASVGPDGAEPGHVIDVRDLEELVEARLQAGRDRAAAALDRKEAALDRRRAAAYLRRAYRDRLTGTLQRDAGQDQLERELERARRTQTPLVIAFLDVVGLKAVNDQRGHGAGDELLRTVGAALASGLRGYDLIVRWGGDEFVCALPNSQLHDGQQRFGDVQLALNRAEPPIGISVGLAEVGPQESLQDAVDRADRDLYAKRQRAHET